MQIIPTFKSTLQFKEINRAFLRLLAQHNGCHFNGKFKSLLADYLGTKNISWVPSARWGLYFILKNLGIPAGSQVILSAFNYYAVPAAIIRAGMQPVFVDISENSLSIDTSKIEEAITDKTKVLIITHLCGFVSGMDSIRAIAKKHGLIIIEDCAQAFGAAYGDTKAGSLGDHAFFTFGLTKNFTTFSNGAVVTQHSRFSEMIERDLSQVQQTSCSGTLIQLCRAYSIALATTKVFFPFIYWLIRGFNKAGIDILDLLFRENEALMGGLPNSGLLNDIQAETGITQLSSLDEKTELCRQKGLKLYNALKDVRGITVPKIEREAKNIFVSCPIIAKDRNKLRKYLLKQGVVTSYGFMRNCSNFKLFPQYSNICINAERVSKEIIYLPLYSSMRDKEIEFIVKCIKNSLS